MIYKASRLTTSFIVTCELVLNSQAENVHIRSLLVVLGSERAEQNAAETQRALRGVQAHCVPILLTYLDMFFWLHIRTVGSGDLSHFTKTSDWTEGRRVL